MGDRICIRIVGPEERSPMFYGHWCGLRALKVMNEVLREEHNGIENLMCNFIIRIMNGKTDPYNYYLYNDDGNTCKAADGDQYCWTFYTKPWKWVTTDPRYNDRNMTPEEVDQIVKTRRPCLFRECPCEHYAEVDPEHPDRTLCQKAFFDKIERKTMIKTD